ncbi:MAG: hypothetical protein Q8S00_04810 [Deltaproteobacteria bacterium]|nr:hypothetical protein [Deltaproteobacteria bacterium]
MGQRRDSVVRDFQRKAGIEPATGGALKVLRRMQEAALDVIRIVELEVSGIRDGDGYWGGACGLEDIDDLPRLLNEYEVECKKQSGELEENPKADRDGDANEDASSL